jgi:hypothetical protein
VKELSDVQRGLVRDLSLGPRTPAELGWRRGILAIAEALEQLEEFGIACMSGSYADGPWQLTAEGQVWLARALSVESAGAPRA